RYNFLRQAPPGWTEEKATQAEEQRKNYEAALDRKMRQMLSRKDAEKLAPEDAKMSAKERAYYWANKTRPRAAGAAASEAQQRLRIAQEREDEVDALDYEEVFEDDEEGDPFPEMLDDDARADRATWLTWVYPLQRLRKILRKTEGNDAYMSEDSDKNSLLSDFLEFVGTEKADAKDVKACSEREKDRAKPSGWGGGPDPAQPGGASKKRKLSARSGKAFSRSAAEKQQQQQQEMPPPPPPPPPSRKVCPPGGGGGGGGLKKKREDSPDGSNKKQKFARPLLPGLAVSSGASPSARPRGIIANRRLP
ncbi:MAG: hypothetical protein BJ554DRAFT_4953, partial [Olpidium bornovanus]